MSPLKLFASIRERRRLAAQQSLEEGAQIMRRLQELLALPAPQEVIANVRIENDNGRLPRPLPTLVLEPARKPPGLAIAASPAPLWRRP